MTKTNTSREIEKIEREFDRIFCVEDDLHVGEYFSEVDIGEPESIKSFYRKKINEIIDKQK